MSDPLRDPNFADRPQHPDFWRLSEIALRLDGRVVEDGMTPDEATRDANIDIESLSYFMLTRRGNALQMAGLMVPDFFHAFVAAAMTDAFFQGVYFERDRPEGTGGKPGEEG